MTERRRIITQGEHMVSADPAMCISTVLGSCVACCLHDPVAGVGGMNHMLLARQVTPNQNREIAGITAMEVLINDVLKLGGEAKRLQAKIFGGAKMIDGLRNIGADNGAFVTEYLDQEGIACVGTSLGGDAARHVLFWPVSGVARQKVKKDIILSETLENPPISPGNGMELL